MKKLQKRIQKWEAQLPLIEGDKLVLTWDVEWAEGETPRFIVRCGEQVILCDETCFVNAREFAAVIDLVCKAYSGRVFDVVPLKDGCLYGHDIQTIEIVNNARQRCRDNHNRREGS